MVNLIQKTRDDYNTIAQFYAATRSHAGELHQFLPLLAPGQQILDWGCGNARLLYLLAELSVHYVGTDISQGQIEIAKRNFAGEVASGKAEFYCTDPAEKIFSENSFDRIFLLASFHHLPDADSRLAILRKLFRELKPNGKIIITVWNLESDWAKEKHTDSWKLIGENDFFIPWKDKDGKLLAERYYHHFSEAELSELLVEAGFDIEKVYFASRDDVTDKRGGKNLIAIATKK